MIRFCTSDREICAPKLVHASGWGWGAERLPLQVTRPDLVWNDETGAPQMLGKYWKTLSTVHEPLPRMVQVVPPGNSNTVGCSTSLPTHQKPPLTSEINGFAFFLAGLYLRGSAPACTAVLLAPAWRWAALVEGAWPRQQVGRGVALAAGGEGQVYSAVGSL